jgi:hypothetical protein
MSTLPPPIPTNGPLNRQATKLPPPIQGGRTGQPGRRKSFSEADLVKASPLPLILGIAAIFASLAIVFVNQDTPLVSVIGYFCTPFLAIAALGLDSVWQRRKTTQFPWFVQNPNFSRLLRVIAVFSLLLSYPHIHIIANHVSAWLAE